jgi:thiol-disulfide isomerase/thioredoxin
MILAACLAGGFLTYRLSVPRPSALSVIPLPAPTPAAAPELAPAPGAAPAPAAGTAASRRIPEDLPPISLPDAAGVKRTLADYRGKLLLVNFWATWCEPCRREIPLLKALRREYVKDGLEIVGIAVDYRDAVAKYALAKGIDYPLLIGEQGGLEAVTAFGMETVLPFSVFADRHGRVVALKVGELHADEAHLILERMQRFDRGQLTLPAAREQIAAGISRLNAARALQAASKE